MVQRGKICLEEFLGDQVGNYVNVIMFQDSCRKVKSEVEVFIKNKNKCEVGILIFQKRMI